MTSRLNDYEASQASNWRLCSGAFRGGEYLFRLISWVAFAAIIYIAIEGPYWKLFPEHDLLFQELILSAGWLLSYKLKNKACLKADFYRNMRQRLIHLHTDKMATNSVSFFDKVGFLFQYLSSRLGEAMHGLTSRYPGRDKLSIPTANRGKGGDIASYEIQDLEGFGKIAKGFGIGVAASNIQLKPFGEGVCMASSLILAREALQSGNFADASQKFVGGAPMEAVDLQAKYDEVWIGKKDIPGMMDLDSARKKADLAIAWSASVEIFGRKNYEELNHIMQDLEKRPDGFYCLYTDMRWTLSIFGKSICTFDVGRHAFLYQKGPDNFFDINYGSTGSKGNFTPDDVRNVFTHYSGGTTGLYEIFEVRQAS